MCSFAHEGQHYALILMMLLTNNDNHKVKATYKGREILGYVELCKESDAFLNLDWTNLIK